MQVDEDLAAWTAGLKGVSARAAGQFHRTEPRLRARAHVQGLSAPLAGTAGNWPKPRAIRRPNGIQRLLKNDIPGLRLSSSSGLVGDAGRPGGGLVVACAGLEAAVEDADEPVGELA